MHEVSIAEGIMEIVSSAAAKAGAKSVSEVRVAVGELSAVETEALSFAFESVKKGTVADRARLVIERPEGRAWCLDCRREVPLHRFGDACPLCGGYHLAPTQGRDMKVIDLKADSGPDEQRNS
ncbi:hydrogenase maturation nickel metallochaperone HypA [Mesosutterella sp. OilRF-GAM-744-9]|uniref:Hydrogenase maturation factor HypA n=1 Tax=Mesosutterella porci TaxID=2915351 RepID=A0ABS9MS16_9BURK|nr:hydrogenase maturation nickel metallochaperone HypA [Mesosutterella sp. oilRF-744-WT-GAM-9]MCG5031416.1 hydrogenase maturation nickel metallochaperone HypA [Mesosutterella sp. oilRF-744-WT-GAM-9]MCI6530333.1 hydrogenase maturation nickel metallochaperone HypA [Mesosutterella sp.]